MHAFHLNGKALHLVRWAMLLRVRRTIELPLASRWSRKTVCLRRAPPAAMHRSVLSRRGVDWGHAKYVIYSDREGFRQSFFLSLSLSLCCESESVRYLTSMRAAGTGASRPSDRRTVNMENPSDILSADSALRVTTVESLSNFRPLGPRVFRLQAARVVSPESAVEQNICSD